MDADLVGTNLYRKMGKRILDLSVGSATFIMVAPFLGVMALVLLITYGLPILFVQQRPGRHRLPFNLLKFRTMSVACNESGDLLPDRARISRVGSFLRKYSLDELPSLWNVLKGDMSLVGPRPLLIEYLHIYSLEQARRHEIKPGITGWAQVNGRNAITWEEKFAYDVWYVDHWSLSLDLKILWLTLIKVLKREGINQPGNATMEKFQGTGGSSGR